MSAPHDNVDIAVLGGGPGGYVAAVGFRDAPIHFDSR